MATEFNSRFSDKIDADALMGVLNEAQLTIRNYDTKAEICGVGFILALGIVKQAGDQIPVPMEWASLYVLVGWLIIVLPIIMFALVLYPSRFDKISRNGRPDDVKGVMYFDTAEFHDVDTFMAAAERPNWVREIVYEIIKVSAIRDVKRKRFLRALFWAGGSFLVLFLSQMLRANGVFEGGFT